MVLSQKKIKIIIIAFLSVLVTERQEPRAYPTKSAER